MPDRRELNNDERDRLGQLADQYTHCKNQYKAAHQRGDHSRDSGTKFYAAAARATQREGQNLGTARDSTDRLHPFPQIRPSPAPAGRRAVRRGRTQPAPCRPRPRSGRARGRGRGTPCPGRTPA